MNIAAETEEIIEIPPFDLVGFMRDHWFTYILILACVIYIYNRVFRAGKLPLLKDAIVYLLMAAGAFVLLIFEVDAGLPIVYCLLAAVGLMIIVRIRYWIIERQKNKQA
jgi:hypothetical protein